MLGRIDVDSHSYSIFCLHLLELWTIKEQALGTRFFVCCPLFTNDGL